MLVMNNVSGKHGGGRNTDYNSVNESCQQI